MAKSKLIQLDINGVKIPVKVMAEPRRNGRVAFGKRQVLLRYPDSLFAKSEQYYIDWATSWLEEKHREKPNIFQRYTGSNINEETSIQIYGIDHHLHFEYIDKVSGSIKWAKDDHLQLFIPKHLNDFDRVEMRRRLLSKFTAKRFLPEITNRVLDINKAHFGKKIKSVKLKYNRSNWGSCSTKNNINLSTRLLLTPEPAMDYVIIHELCHLIEMNHSPAFYKEVIKRCPDYRKQEIWLDKNFCDF